MFAAPAAPDCRKTGAAAGIAAAGYRVRATAGTWGEGYIRSLIPSEGWKAEDKQSSVDAGPNT